MLSHALQLFSMALKSQPAGSHILENCWSCANDLVWLILSEAAPVQKDQQWAVELAQQATQAEPQNAAYWTTLGAASLSAGEPAKALAALERSMSIRDGGTGFDHVFLALAKARLDERDQAQVWLNRAEFWVKEHSPCPEELLPFLQLARARSHPIRSPGHHNCNIRPWPPWKPVPMQGNARFLAPSAQPFSNRGTGSWNGPFPCMTR